MEENSASMEITGQIMVIAIIVLFVVVVFILFLHLYAKRFSWCMEQPPAPPSSRRQRRHFAFAPGQEPALALRAGLSPAILRSIPVLTFNPEEFKDGLECAVCLSELVQGQKARLLPKCNHGFHIECIDMWFQSHSTCPLCRNTIDLEGSSSVSSESSQEIDVESLQENSASWHSIESPHFPTNVLFWGTETQVSTAGACSEEGDSSSSSSSSSSALQTAISSSSSELSISGLGNEMLVIDIPVSMSEHLSSSLYPDQEESKSSAPRRLRSLKRLLSREKRVNPCSSGSDSPSSSSCDVEQVRRG